MKFAKLLRVTATELPEVEDVLTCYKTSKKVLKSWPDGSGGADAGAAAARDAEFVQTLSRYLARCIRKWDARLQAMRIRCGALEQQHAVRYPVVQSRRRAWRTGSGIAAVTPLGPGATGEAPVMPVVVAAPRLGHRGSSASSPLHARSRPAGRAAARSLLLRALVRA